LMLPLKDKTVKSVADAFKEIFKISKRKPEKLWTDKGCEFYNKHVRELGVELYSTENEEKSSVAERWNRTMKERMYKYFTANKLVLALYLTEWTQLRPCSLCENGFTPEMTSQ